MSNILLRQACRSARNHTRPTIVLHARCFHITQPAHKKGQKFSKAHYVASMDEKSEAEDEWFETAEISSLPESPSSNTSETKRAPPVSSRKLSPEARLARFNQVFQFAEERMGLRPISKTPQVRNSAWIHLFGLATSPEQLEKVSNMFSRWTDSRRAFTSHHSEMFVRRCEELGCPLLALKVFGDHSKYGLQLSLPAARHLLHSLHQKHPIEQTVAAAALYRVYNLPAISTDLISCSMLVSACLKHNNKASRLVAIELLPHIQEMLCNTDAVPIPADPQLKARDKPKVWLNWTLVKIEEALAKQAYANIEWLQSWLRSSRPSPSVVP